MLPNFSKLEIRRVAVLQYYHKKKITIGYSTHFYFVAVFKFSKLWRKKSIPTTFHRINPAKTDSSRLWQTINHLDEIMHVCVPNKPKYIFKRLTYCKIIQQQIGSYLFSFSALHNRIFCNFSFCLSGLVNIIRRVVHKTQV
jgi:hypothetical protein